MIISFNWTVGAFLQGKKTVTRRFWKSKYAAKFHEGDIVDAYDKSPRNGGKKIGHIRLTKDPYKQPLENMTEEDFQREGGTMYWEDKKNYIVMMRRVGNGEVPWVIEFEKIQEAGVAI
jgi:hypothetical protein